MTLAILVFVAGMLTILSPCILPVLPFVFARAEQPFLKSGLPLLAGMALTFAGVATLAAVGGSWAIHINQYGRIAALVLMAAFALTLLSRRLAAALARPFTALGNRLTQVDMAAGSETGLLRSLLLGVATGLLWAPCAGPILGLVLTGAAVSGPNANTTLLLFAYAAGAAVSLAAALFAGGRLFAALKQTLGAGEWVRRGLGVVVLVAVVAIASGIDTGLLTRWSLGGTDRFEQALIARIHPLPPSRSMVADGAGVTHSGRLPIEGQLPSLAGAVAWLNSPPLTPASLRGKVVLLDFWTYSCINCLRSLPYVSSWYESYKDHGLVVIGVHTPEFAFEKDAANVSRAVRDLGVTYPVALDSNYAIWKAFDNHYWPAHYFVDAEGRIRGHHFGEGSYSDTEQTLRQLLTEAGFENLPPAGIAAHGATGVKAASDDTDMLSPETYIGYARSQHFKSSSGVVPDQPARYAAPDNLALNEWALAGTWTIGKEKAILNSPSGSVVFRFHARDLHLVLGPGTNGKPVGFRVRLDGAEPGSSHGVDIDASGVGVIEAQRLYQLIRQPGDVHRHTFTLEFLDSGAQVYSFTFG